MTTTSPCFVSATICIGAGAESVLVSDEVAVGASLDCVSPQPVAASARRKLASAGPRRLPTR
jgi:hypothetical protein